jgi:hypothetical protein
MGFLRHIIGLIIALLVTALGAVAMPVAPTAANQAEFFPHQPAAVAEHADVHFAARAPPSTVADVAVKGPAVAEHGNGIVMHGHETQVVGLVFGVGLDAPNRGAFRTTDAVSVTGARSIDKAQSYETGVREIYGGASLSDRSFTVIVDGRRVNGIADDVTVINGRTTAVDAKFTDDWATSIRNPNSPNGNQPWAVAEQQKMVDQARNYSEAFDGGAIYHTNNQALAQHYTKVFNDAGISNFEFVVTPTR